jgi:glycopeptide antibiotics resistance protein
MTPPQRIIINIRDTRGDRESAEARRILARWLVGLTVLMVLFCGMFPFDFDFKFATAISEIHRRFDLTIDQLWTAGDGLENVVFFLPVGFALGSLLWDSWRRPIGWIVIRCALAILCAAALSTIVELSQVYLVSRDPSLADICSNTTGGVLGFGLFILVGESVMRFLVRQLTAVRRIKDARVFGTAVGVWLLIAMLAPILARNLSRLNNWQPAYPLLTGNETDGSRFWNGTVSNVWLSAASVGEDGLESALVSTDPGKLLHDSLLMAFHFDGHGPYADATGDTGALGWTGDPSHGASAAATEPSDLTGVMAIGRVGVPVSSAWWLRTANGGAAKACERISQTDAFTLVLDVAAGTLEQGDGWPRIFSISKDTRQCNLQLLQDRENLEIRLRSGATGEGGTDPEFIVPGIFIDTSPRRVVVSYDHGRLLVACDQTGERYSAQYSPDAWLVWRIYPRGGWPYRMDSSGQVVASAMYRVLAMLPIGVLLGAVLRILGQTRYSHQARHIFIGAVCIAELVLELLLHYGAGTPFSWSAPITGLVAGCVGTAAILGHRPVRGRSAN